MEPSNFLNQLNHEIQAVESRLGETHSTKYLQIQQNVIEILQGALSHQKEFIPDEYQEKVTKLDENMSSILKKTEELKSHVILGKDVTHKAPLEKDPGVYKLIGEKPLENGTQFTLKEIDTEVDLNPIVFPATVFPLTRVQKTRNAFGPFWEILSQLGYEFDFENKIITLPDCDLLNANCQRIKDKYPELSSFEAVSSEGLASDIEFIDAFLEGKTILSNDIEFTHDHLVHIISELLMRIAGEYSPVRETVGIALTPVRDVLRKAQDQLDKLPDENKEKEEIEIAIKQLFTLCSIWLDDHGSDYTRPLSKFTDQCILNFPRLVSSVKGGSILSTWRKYFNEQYPDSPLTEKRSEFLTLLLTIIHYPTVDKFFDEFYKKLTLKEIHKTLEGIEVVEHTDPCRLSFKTDSKEFNIEDNPLEVFRMVKSALEL